MAVMDDLISESSNVVGVSSTGPFLHKEALHVYKYTQKCLALVNRFVTNLSTSPSCLLHQIPSPLRSCLMRGWRGLWWRALWQLSVFWQRQYCSAL